LRLHGNNAYANASQCNVYTYIACVVILLCDTSIACRNVQEGNVTHLNPVQTLITLAVVYLHGWCCIWQRGALSWDTALWGLKFTQEVKKFVAFSQKTPESLLQRKNIADSVSSAASGRVLSHAKRLHIFFNLKVQYCLRKNGPPHVAVLSRLNPTRAFCRNHFTSMLWFAPRHTLSFCTIGATSAASHAQ